MNILALESSCDETAIALLEANGDLNLQKNKVYSQVDIHRQYGGVIPEVAARKHLETIIPLMEDALGKSKLRDVDYLAVTSGPGLITSLLLGTTVAKTLAFSNNLPLVPVNHMEGHVYSNWLSNKELAKDSKKYFSALILIVSGGHTELVLMKDHGQYQLLGQTLDDAVGEAFDKVAKLLSLGYPGGPIVSKLADKGDPAAYKLPRPMLNEEGYNFSFSGLKTAVLYTLEKQKKISEEDVVNMCASFQQAVLDVLVTKTMKAAENFPVKSIMIAGGVAANKDLRNSLKKASKGIPFFVPDMKYTGDNAAMMATAAYYNIISKRAKILKGKEILELQPQSNWRLSNK